MTAQSTQQKMVALHMIFKLKPLLIMLVLSNYMLLIVIYPILILSTNQPPFRNIDSYYNTSCLTGNKSHTVEISLKGNNYYFFGILYNETAIKITISANTSQYSVDESDENCTTSANSEPCTFSASNFNDALKVHLGKPCLVSQTSDDVNHENITVAMKSQVGGVYSLIAMIVVFFAGVVSVAICCVL